MIVELTFDQLEFAATIGVQRTVSAFQKSRKHAYGATDQDAYQKSIIGAVGEFAVSQALSIEWPIAPCELDKTDVGPYNVRTTDHPRGRLIVHDNDKDPDGGIFIFARFHYPNFVHLPGYIFGWQAKRPEFWEDPTGNNRPAFFVDIRHLAPLTDLPKR